MRVQLRAFLALAVLSLCLVLVGPAGSAQAYPPTTCASLTVSTTHPAEGATITVSGTNFLANTTVKLVLHTKTYLLATVTTDANGTFSVEVTLPAGVTGHHKLVAAGGSNGLAGCPADPFQIIDIQGGTVTPSPTSTNGNPGGGGTAFTGLDVAALLGLAALLVGAGVLFNRRGRASSHGSSHRA